MSSGRASANPRLERPLSCRQPSGLAASPDTSRHGEQPHRWERCGRTLLRGFTSSPTKRARSTRAAHEGGRTCRCTAPPPAHLWRRGLVSRGRVRERRGLASGRHRHIWCSCVRCLRVGVGAYGGSSRRTPQLRPRRRRSLAHHPPCRKPGLRGNVLITSACAVLPQPSGGVEARTCA